LLEAARSENAMDAFVANFPDGSEVFCGSMFQETGNDGFGGLMNAAASEVARYAFEITPEGLNVDENPLMYEEPQTISFHSHPLTWKRPYGLKQRWFCDICESQHGGKKRGQAEESWHCQICCFDLCRDCFKFVRNKTNYEDGFMTAHYAKEKKVRSVVEMLPLKKPTTKSSALLLEEVSPKELASFSSELDFDTETFDGVDCQDLKQIDISLNGLSSTDDSIQGRVDDNDLNCEAIQINEENSPQGIDDSRSRTDESLSTTDDSVSRTDENLSQAETDTSISEEDVR